MILKGIRHEPKDIVVQYFNTLYGLLWPTASPNKSVCFHRRHFKSEGAFNITAQSVSGIALSKLKHLLPHTNTRRPVAFLATPLACCTSAAHKMPWLIPWVIASETNNFHANFTSLSYISSQTPSREAQGYNAGFKLLSTQGVMRGVEKASD